MKYNTFTLVLLGSLILLSVCAWCPVAGFTLKPIQFGQAFPDPCHVSYETETYATMNAAFTADRVKGSAPLLVNFFDASFGFPRSYRWDFGDGTFSTEKNPVHVYEEAGSYDVALTISDGIYYETAYALYNATGSGQLTDISFSSAAREYDYITVLEPGSEEAIAFEEEYEEDPFWYPVRQKGVTMPSGQLGVVGSATLNARTITITNSTQTGFTDTLSVSGIYRMFKRVPHNTQF